jgi:hypothetical protein
MNRHAIVSSDHEKDHVKLPHPHIAMEGIGPIALVPLYAQGFETGELDPVSQVGTGPNTAAFTWVKKQVAKGWHKLTIVSNGSAAFQTEEGTARARARTTTLQVYKP